MAGSNTKYSTRKGSPEEAIAKMDDRMQERRIDATENLPYSNDKTKQSIDRTAYYQRMDNRISETVDYFDRRKRK